MRGRLVALFSSAVILGTLAAGTAQAAIVTPSFVSPACTSNFNLGVQVARSPRCWPADVAPLLTGPWATPSGLDRWYASWVAAWRTSPNGPWNPDLYGGQCPSSVRLGQAHIPFVLFSGFVHGAAAAGTLRLYDYDQRRFIPGGQPVPASDWSAGPRNGAVLNAPPWGLLEAHGPLFNVWDYNTLDGGVPWGGPASRESQAKSSLYWYAFDIQAPWAPYYLQDVAPPHVGHYGLVWSNASGEGGVNHWEMPMATSILHLNRQDEAGAEDVAGVTDVGGAPNTEPWWPYSGNREWSGTVGNIVLCDFAVSAPDLSASKIRGLARSGPRLPPSVRRSFGTGLSTGQIGKLIGAAVEGLHLAHPHMNLGKALSRFHAARFRRVALPPVGSKVSYPLGFRFGLPGLRANLKTPSVQPVSVPLVTPSSSPSPSPSPPPASDTRSASQTTVTCPGASGPGSTGHVTSSGFPATLDVSGTVTPAAAGSSVTVTYTPAYNGPTQVHTVSTDASGAYSDQVTVGPDQTYSQWTVQAAFGGDSNRKPSGASCAFYATYP